MNRLAAEQSPYLLQHAGNPVDWYPWGAAAFARARNEDKPIFLSVGYSTCHWCHVMEHESFEDPAIAALLNEHFVSVKVDREERPDVDRVYMTFVQGTTGSGGWPMSVWLTPDLKPFYGGTYFPPTSRWNRPGFIDVLRELHRAWTSQRDRIERSADSVTEQLRQSVLHGASQAVPGADVLAPIVKQFRSAYDTRHGGFGGAPKFPRPSELLFLLREHARTGDTDARDMVLNTLQAMALGGMRDHVGGGFHRYSVDAGWRVPHFEKMLYDQAQLVLACVEATQVSGDRFFLDVAEDTLRYVMREMTDPHGGFYSAEDADSVPPEHAHSPDQHKMEGAFYLWRSDEVDQLFAAETAAIVKGRFGIQESGNAPSDPQQEFTGKNLLYVAKSTTELATDSGLNEDAVATLLEQGRLTLFRARLSRPRPHLDDKVLTAWNGLMIAAFARTARVLRATDDDAVAAFPYLDAARRAARFLKDTMWRADSRTLLRRYRRGHAAIEGYAEDYAFVVSGLIELFQADPQAEWLAWAVELQNRQDELFWDEKAGGWFSTTGEDDTVLMRMKEEYDGAEPAPSSVSALNVLTLSQLQHNPEWDARLRRTFGLFAARLNEMGRGVPMMAAALSAHVAGLTQVVITGTGPAAIDLNRTASAAYRPFTIVLALTSEMRAQLGAAMPWLASMRDVDGQPAAYLCRNFTCGLPVTSPEALDQQLAERR